ncbi:CST complex subunit TEN1-like [Mercenaria mercenaria]|uniref:CST complex subunit TEN1-like n=1 Tax=Mercenaria mercenaria TaxID=6596 RepID=UPI00234F9926|nr:CST complex subunit TEN1-like [Mercenaria mercenaria]
MDNIGVASGKPTFIDEVSQCNDKSALHGQSVCVTGRLTLHEFSACLAKLTDPQSKSEICIDTSLIEPFQARFGSQFQMIGELEPGSQHDIVLKARVVRCVDGLDMSLYRKAIECQRMYLQKRNS